MKGLEFDLICFNKDECHLDVIAEIDNADIGVYNISFKSLQVSDELLDSKDKKVCSGILKINNENSSNNNNL